MAKRANTYQLTPEPRTLASGAAATREPLRLTIENHDELFAIIDRLQAKNLFHTPQQAAEFGLGLKLFSEVLLAHRQQALFQAFRPAFSAFMQQLKDA